ncbi:MAG: hypothetical protein LUB61_03420 [Eggerthellaceae bacterium]|nr:hypothetical protein [Eggerthellaceae bacterium]
MPAFGHLLDDYISKQPSSLTNSMKAHRNNHLFRESVLEVWKDNPDGAQFLLEHINALYFMKDKAPKKANSQDEFYCEIAVDDSMAKAEINARRELLVLSMQERGFDFSSLRIVSARGNMKQRHPFIVEEKDEEEKPLSVPLERQASPETLKSGFTAVFHRAAAIVWKENCFWIVSHITDYGINYKMMFTRKKHRFRGYAVTFDVTADDESAAMLVEAYSGALIGACHDLGLVVRGVKAHFEQEKCETEISHAH